MRATFIKVFVPFSTISKGIRRMVLACTCADKEHVFKAITTNSIFGGHHDLKYLNVVHDTTTYRHTPNMCILNCVAWKISTCTSLLYHQWIRAQTLQSHRLHQTRLQTLVLSLNTSTRICFISSVI